MVRLSLNWSKQLSFISELKLRMKKQDEILDARLDGHYRGLSSSASHWLGDSSKATVYH
ncbi:hypothetical protein HT118_03370 [Escherichia coli]|nr:hypothetical protein [Escherichia coli]